MKQPGPQPARQFGLAPSSFPLYYGWVIVGVIFLSAIASAVQLNPTIGVFVKPMTAEFGWSRSDIAGAVTVGTIFGGILAFLVGPVIDRFGARWVLAVAFLLMGGLLIALGRIDALWQFYAITICTRLLLQGVVNLTNQTVVAKWFVRLRGRALALANLGQRVGTGLVPYFAQAIILAYSWRVAIASIGLLTWGLTLVPVVLWLRRQPQDLGLLPDGGPPPESAGKAQQATESRGTEVSYTLRQALRTRTFYVLTGAFCLGSFVNTGVNFNLVPYLSDRGLTETEAVVILMVWSFAGILGTLAAGFLAERLPNQALIVGTYMGLAIGILVLTLVQTFWMGFLFGLLHGAFFAAVLLMQNLILANYYGAASLATLRGAILPWQMSANAVGPLAATLVFDATGSYSVILFTYVGLQTLVWLALLLAKPPARMSLAPRLSGSEDR